MQKGTNIQECLEMAYNEIKGRTGKMVDGVFVKSSDLKQLDESQKPVIPQLVAGWIEKSTDFFTKAEKIAYLINSKDGDSYYFCDWFVRDGILTQEQGEELLTWATRQSYETLLSLYNGYEVEKVPKYIVKIGKLYLKEPLGDTSNSTILTTWDKKRAYPFSSFHTADKHADKFEGAVEEVAEG
ncbi:DUF1642 domain-containing protein [Enterococcus faecium]|nr:DUF1642 domain-containing protein [Enterococcus faecium]